MHAHTCTCPVWRRRKEQLLPFFYLVYQRFLQSITQSSNTKTTRTSVCWLICIHQSSKHSKSRETSRTTTKAPLLKMKSWADMYPIFFLLLLLLRLVDYFIVSWALGWPGLGTVKDLWDWDYFPTLTDARPILILEHWSFNPPRIKLCAWLWWCSSAHLVFTAYLQQKWLFQSKPYTGLVYHDELAMMGLIVGQQ